MTYSSIFGAFTGRDEIAQAVVDLLQQPPSTSAFPLTVYYLAEVERKQGLQPRTIDVPVTYRSGLDFERWKSDDLPALIVVAQPIGDSERYQDGLYAQWYDMQVGAIVNSPDGDESVSQQLADWYGAAIMLLLSQHGGLGNPDGFEVAKTVLTSGPRTEFVPNSQRTLAVSVVAIRSLVEQIVGEHGPVSFGPDPYQRPQDWPTVTTVDVGVTAESLAGVLDSPEGVTVTQTTTTSAGSARVIVNE